MKPEDVFADEVIVHRPVGLECSIVGAVSDRSDVIGKCIKPYISDVRCIPWQGNSPGECLATYRKVIQSCLDKSGHFIEAISRCDAVGMIGVPLEQAIFKAGESKEIVFFFDMCCRCVVNWALAVHQLVINVVSLAGHAVLTTVHIKFNVASVIARLQ